MTIGFGEELARRLGALEQEMRRVRAGLVRVGTVAGVDATAGTITVKYISGVTSAPMPWFQRGSEHRPPQAGEHVIVLDPSLQGTSAIAIAGHPSHARPPAAGGGEKHVIHADPGGDADTYEEGKRTVVAREVEVRAERVLIVSGDVRLGENPTDFVALASKVDDYVAAMDGMFRSWTPMAQDGGAALKAAFSSSFSASPGSVSSAIARTA